MCVQGFRRCGNRMSAYRGKRPLCGYSARDVLSEEHIPRSCDKVLRITLVSRRGVMDLYWAAPGGRPYAASFAVLCELCARNPLEKERYVERKARKVPQSSQNGSFTVSAR